MNSKAVLNILGSLSMILAFILLVPAGLALYDDYHAAAGYNITKSFILTIVIALICGLIVKHFTAKDSENQLIKPAEGFAISGLGWILLSFWGALPFYLSGTVENFTDGFFEVISGFTTTGSSIFGTAKADGGVGLIEKLPRSILLWRSLTHWLGGMGIVVLSLAVLPALRAGGYQLFAAEVPGPTAEKLRPRLKDTAAILWGVYVLLSLAEMLLLWRGGPDPSNNLQGGMSLLDSICHTFGTMATGGFSTKDASIGHYAKVGHANAVYFEYIIILFMFLAGSNFVLHYKALHGELGSYKHDAEFKFYTKCVLGATLIVTLATWVTNMESCQSLSDAFRTSLFQILSVTTTTGFATADFDVWPNICRILMVVMMFLGGCAGSTGGGIKMIRIQVVLKNAVRELKRLINPRAVISVKQSEMSIKENLISNIMVFVTLYLIIFTVAVILTMASLELSTDYNSRTDANTELITATTAVVATLNNIGPGLGGVGATCNYSSLPISTKWILCLCMLIGRLEVYTIIVMFLPFTWRK
ncbi:MAG: TrkH family potassium uptake protein [Planctomycetota bacterium]|jgi:trk system potassium uptake protein TrkH